MPKRKLSKWDREDPRGGLSMGSKKYRSPDRDQEKDTSIRADATLQPGSGSQVGKKGDSKSEVLLIENKVTEGESIAVSKKWLVKICGEAISYRKIPVLAFGFTKIHPMVSKTWWAIPEKEASNMIKFCKDNGYDFEEK